MVAMWEKIPRGLPGLIGSDRGGRSRSRHFISRISGHGRRGRLHLQPAGQHLASAKAKQLLQIPNQAFSRQQVQVDRVFGRLGDEKIPILVKGTDGQDDGLIRVVDHPQSGLDTAQYRHLGKVEMGQCFAGPGIQTRQIPTGRAHQLKAGHRHIRAHRHIGINRISTDPKEGGQVHPGRSTGRKLQRLADRSRTGRNQLNRQGGGSTAGIDQVQFGRVAAIYPHLGEDNGGPRLGQIGSIEDVKGQTVVKDQEKAGQVVGAAGGLNPAHGSRVLAAREQARDQIGELRVGFNGDRILIGSQDRPGGSVGRQGNVGTLIVGIHDGQAGECPRLKGQTGKIQRAGGLRRREKKERDEQPKAHR